MARKDPPNLLPSVPADPDSDPGLSDSSLLDSSKSSYYEHSKQIRFTNNNNNKHQSKKRFDPIKKCANITSKLLTAAYKKKVIKFRLDKYPLHCQFY